jgi:hypothetical protein
MIVVDDLVLMEIPSQVLVKRKKAIAASTAQQMKSVEFDLEKTALAGHPIVSDNKSSVSHPGVRVQPRAVADDE